MFANDVEFNEKEKLLVVKPCWVQGKFFSGKPTKENDQIVFLGGEDKAILLLSKKAVKVK